MISLGVSTRSDVLPLQSTCPPSSWYRAGPHSLTQVSLLQCLLQHPSGPFLNPFCPDNLQVTWPFLRGQVQPTCQSKPSSRPHWDLMFHHCKDSEAHSWSGLHSACHAGFMRLSFCASLFHSFTFSFTLDSLPRAKHSRNLTE